MHGCFTFSTSFVCLLVFTLLQAHPTVLLAAVCIPCCMFPQIHCWFDLFPVLICTCIISSIFLYHVFILQFLGTGYSLLVGFLFLTSSSSRRFRSLWLEEIWASTDMQFVTFVIFCLLWCSHSSYVGWCPNFCCRSVQTLIVVLPDCVLCTHFFCFLLNITATSSYIWVFSFLMLCNYCIIYM